MFGKDFSSKYMIKSYLMILLLSFSVQAGTTGKIAGRIMDGKTNEPLIAANIILQGTTMGATSDEDGFYFIINIPPGKYNLEVLYIGYDAVVYSDIKVSVDQTTKIDFTLIPETLESETIRVVAERPIVQKDLTSTMAKISGDQISALPIEDITDVVNLQAGVVEGHFRGGRQGEVKYLIDGIAVNDVFSGDFSLQAEVNSIEEVQVLTGTFNAEYGEALSGVVNQITKIPGKDYNGEISTYTGDYVSARNNIFLNIDNYNPTDIFNIQGSIGGPVPGLEEYLRFFLSGRYFKNNGSIYGKRVFNPADSSVFSDDPETRYIGATGDNEFVSMNFSNRINIQGKLHIRLGGEKWLVLQGLYQKRNYKEYNHRYRLNPDGDYNRFQNGFLTSASYTHIFSNSTFVDFKASAFLTESKRYVYKNPLDSRYVNPERKRDVSGNAFLSGGTENWHFFNGTDTYTGKIDITSQISNAHLIKAGVDIQQHQLDYKVFQVHVDASSGYVPALSKAGSFDYNTYTNNPLQLAAYIQDKIELDYLVVNVGVRYDYFEPDGIVLNDPNKIAALDALSPPFPDSLFSKASAKHQFSPRVGVSYPISEKGAIHISYGHFFQIPPFDFLYRNPNFRIPLSGNFPDFIGNTIGNADLKPQRTTMYEIGLQQELMPYVGMTVTAYAKDIRNLLGQEIYIKNDFRKFAKYINRDYGFVKGFTISLEKILTNDGFGASIDYTYQIAQGNSSDENAAFENASASTPIEENKKLSPLDWDRTHSLNLTSTFGTPGDYIISFISKLGSGLPYTPSLQNQRTGLENSDKKPMFFTSDLYITKYLTFGQARATAFLKVYNLFDTANEREVFGDTGRAGTTLELTRAQVAPRGMNTLKEFFTRPDFYSAPRQIVLGLSYAF
jgi:TonB dependent receptor-like, beta-barrel/CarboxypepD_reg-like domain/TonB-dependent Receptor Plug Domain